MKKCKEVDIYRDAGDTFPERIFVWSILDGAVIDISTGYTFVMVVASVKDATPGDSNELFTVNGTIVSGSEGQIEFAPSSPDVDIVGDMFYEMRMTDPNSKVRTIRKGRYVVA